METTDAVQEYGDLILEMMAERGLLPDEKGSNESEEAR